MTKRAGDLPSAAGAAEQVTIRQMLQREYDHYIRAVREKDIPNTVAALTPDFVWTLLDGTTYNRQETEAALREDFQKRIALEQMTITILEFTTNGTEATVLVQEKSKGLREEEGMTRFLTVESMRETWKKTLGGWQISAATVLESLTLRMSIDASEQGNVHAG